MSKPRTARQSDEPLMSPREVSIYLGGIPLRTLDDWRLRAVGPIALRVGRHIRYRREDVDQWLSEREVA